MREDHPAIRILEIILALALLGSLAFAGWRVYRSLPAEGSSSARMNQAAGNLELTIVWREGVAGETRVELYPIDFDSMRREFTINGRPGKNFDDFLAKKLKTLTPVRAQVNQTGRAVARLSEGHWWMRATSVSSNGESVEWRLPMLIAQRTQTIELSKDNSYERTKKF